MTPRRAAPLLVAATLLAYATAFVAGFQFDDFHVVVDNPDLAGWAAWAASMPGIRALTKASLVASRSLALGVPGFVAVSLACHLAAAACLLALLRRSIPAWTGDAEAAPAIALLAALLFALHPAQTEAVTYVSGRSVVLAGALGLASLGLQLRDPEPRAGRTAVSCALFAAALAARETAWTLPFALVLMEAAGGTRLRVALLRARWHFAVLGIALAAFAASPTYRYLLATSVEFRAPADSLFVQVRGIAYLVTHPLLTLRLNFDPDLAAAPRIDGAWLASAALVAGLACVAAWQWRRRRWLAAGLLWFLLHLAPTNGAIARFDLVNDRQLYLALAGPAWIAAVTLSRIGRPGVARGIAVALVVVLATATALRNADYRSEATLWEATVRVSPGKPRAWNNLGYAREQQGDVDAAREAYRRALALDPAYSRARINLDRIGDGPRPAR